MTRVFLFSLPLIEVHKIVEKFVKTFHILAGGVLGILLVAMPAGADLAAAESQLHMVLVCDDAHPQLGEGFQVNEWALRSTLVEGVASSRLKLLNPDHYREGGAPPLTRELLLDYLAALPVQPDDALIVYLACECGETVKGNQWFQFSDDKSDDRDVLFTRAEILEVLEEKQVRLVGLITDGGTEYNHLETELTAISGLAPPVTETSPLCERLFFKSTGVLNVASAAPAEAARYHDNYTELGKIPKQDRVKKLIAAEIQGEDVGDDHDLRYGRIRFADNPLQGGYFTESLVKILQDSKTQELTWVKVLAATDTEMNDRLRGLSGNPQTVQLLTLPGVTIPQTDPQDQDSEGTLHVILACDVDDPNLGEGFEINEGVVRSQFIDSVATRNLRYYDPWDGGTDGPKLTAENLLEEIDNIQLKPNDTLMVYLACHGFWDKDDDEHWFRFENDGDDSALLRKTLIRRIKSRNTRLGMLVTDSCTNYEKLPSDRIDLAPLGPPLEETVSLYQSLFFDQQGFLDLSSSSPGQFTLYYNNYKDMKAGDKIEVNKYLGSRQIPGSDDMLGKYSMKLNGDTMRGGLFTESMRSLLLAKSDEKLDWKEFTELLRDDVENRFDQEIPNGELKTGAGNIFQDAQTVAVGEFPKPLGGADLPTDPEPGSFEASEKFGVSGIASDDGGFLILTVDDDSQASRHGLSVGEVIEKINNQPVNTPEELEAALSKAPATFRVTIGGKSFVVRP